MKERKCPICGKDLGRNKIYCSQECRAKGVKHYRKCTVCGEFFWAAPTSQVRTCGQECEKKLRSENGKNGASAENLRIAQEAAKHSHNSGKFPENAIAKSWVIKSPGGTIYYIDNLKLWAEQHTELFPTTPLQFADGIRRIKATLLGKRKRGSYQYKGWRLIDWSETNNSRADITPRQRPTRRKKKRTNEERLQLKREKAKDRYHKKHK